MKLISVYKKNKDITCDYMRINNVAFIDIDDLLKQIGSKSTVYRRKNILKTMSLAVESLDCSLKDINIFLFDSLYVRHDVAVLFIVSIHKSIEDRFRLVKAINKAVLDAQSDKPVATMYITVPEEFVDRSDGFIRSKIKTSEGKKRIEHAFYQMNKEDRISACKAALKTHKYYTTASESLNISFKTLKKYISM